MDKDKDKQLEFECRQAMLRHHYKSPVPEDEWDAFQRQINVNKKMSEHRRRRLRSSVYWYFAGGTFVGLLAILICIHVWNSNETSTPIIVCVASEDKNDQVTLDGMTLDDFRSLQESQVNEHILVESSKADFSQSKKHSSIDRVIKTPRNKDFKILLSDGTEVFLNAESKLVFPEYFTEKERKVYLEGEAYFSVSRNVDKPFYVITNKISTKVLGTEFNVKSYQDTPFHVTLISGSVSVNVPSVKNDIKLSPGQDISIVNNKIEIREVDINPYIQWKEGYFYYDNVTLEAILRDLGKWYNITIEIRQPGLKDFKLHFIADRNSGIEEVVYNLNELNEIFATLKDGKLIVEQKK